MAIGLERIRRSPLGRHPTIPLGPDRATRPRPRSRPAPRNGPVFGQCRRPRRRPAGLDTAGAARLARFGQGFAGITGDFAARRRPTSPASPLSDCGSWKPGRRPRPSKTAARRPMSAALEPPPHGPPRPGTAPPAPTSPAPARRARSAGSAPSGRIRRPGAKPAPSQAAPDPVMGNTAVAPGSHVAGVVHRLRSAAAARARSRAKRAPGRKIRPAGQNSWDRRDGRYGEINHFGPPPGAPWPGTARRAPETARQRVSRQPSPKGDAGQRGERAHGPETRRRPSRHRRPAPAAPRLVRRRRRRLAASDSAFSARHRSGRSARARRPCASGSARASPECRRLRPACTAARAAWADCRSIARQCKPRPTIRPPRESPACGRRNSTRPVAARSARGPPGVPTGLALLFARPGSAPARHARPGAYGYPFYGDTRQVSRRR